MFKFLRHSVPAETADSRCAAPSRLPSVPPSAKPHSDIQREFVRVVLKDTMRRHGIASEWLSCEVNNVTTEHGTEELHIQLVLMQWHELLMRYARALELQLLRGLDRFEPMVDHSKTCVISWRFSPECGCPFTVLPPPVVWTHSAEQEPVKEEVVSVLDRRHATRPPKASTNATPNTATSQLTEPAAQPGRRGGGDDSGNYERTELSPFR